MRLTTLLLCLLLTGPLYAAPGGSMGGGMSTQPVKRLTPEERAVKSYNKGIRERDKAWEYEAQAAELESGKKQERLIRKADKVYKRAVKYYRTAIQHYPNFYQAHSSLGYALRKTGDYDGSLASYNFALELNPSYAEAIEYRAEVNLALGNLDDTRTAYQQLMRLEQAKAAELMQAIDSWLQNPPDTVSEEQLADFRAWAVERKKLSHFINDLSGQSVPWAGG